jgi:hypothetical protein
MGRAKRRNLTGSIYRQGNVAGNNNRVIKGETLIHSNYKWHRWNITAHDREAMVTEYGFERTAHMFFGEGAYVSDLLGGDVIVNSDGERYQIMAINPVRGGGSTPVALSFVLQLADDKDAT